MPGNSWLRAAAASLLTAALTSAALAAEPQEAGATTVGWTYLEGGSTSTSSDATYSLTAGILLPMKGFGAIERKAGPLTLHWDIWASHWQSRRGEGTGGGLTQAGATAVWRFLPLPARPDWFVDLGLGGSLVDRLYAHSGDRFSTAFQFTEVVGLGYRFGPGGAYEVSLRAQHFSNGGIKKPNPGVNFVRLRFATRW